MSKITEHQLMKMGILNQASKLKPYNYWCNATQSYMAVHKTGSMESLVQDIFDEGVRQGIEEGKEQRSDQLLRLLNNEDL